MLCVYGRQGAVMVDRGGCVAWRVEQVHQAWSTQSCHFGSKSNKPSAPSTTTKHSNTPRTHIQHTKTYPHLPVCCLESLHALSQQPVVPLTHCPGRLLDCQLALGALYALLAHLTRSIQHLSHMCVCVCVEASNVCLTTQGGDSGCSRVQWNERVSECSALLTPTSHAASKHSQLHTATRHAAACVG